MSNNSQHIILQTQQVGLVKLVEKKAAKEPVPANVPRVLDLDVCTVNDLKTWHPFRKTHKVTFACATCNAQVVLRKGTPKFPIIVARHPRSKHACKRFGGARAGLSALGLDKNIIGSLKNKKQDFSRYRIRLKSRRKRVVAHYGKALEKVGGRDRNAKEVESDSHTLKGFLMVVAEASGLGIWQPNRDYVRSFDEIVPHLNKFCNSPDFNAAALRQKIVFPEEETNAVAAVHGACAANDKKHRSLENRAIIVYRATRTTNGRISMIGMNNLHLCSTAQQREGSAKSHGKMPARFESAHGERQALVIALVEKRGSSLSLVEIAWCFVNNYGMIAESDYEHQAFAILAKERIAFIKLLYYTASVGEGSYRCDVIIPIPGKEPIIVEIDPNGSRSKDRKVERDNDYQNSGLISVSWDPVKFSELPPKLEDLLVELGIYTYATYEEIWGFANSASGYNEMIRA